jgi:hypothetical protein
VPQAFFGEGREAENAQQKKKTMKTPNSDSRLQDRTAQASGAEVYKYIVLVFNGAEQVTVFPFSVKHSDLFDYMKRQCADIRAVSAGFFIRDEGVIHCFGRSESLDLSSRLQDQNAVESFYESNDRQPWDLIALTAEAPKVARQNAT